MATDENTPPTGEGKLSVDAVALVYETRVAVESVSAGVELLARREDLPPAAKAELGVLAKLAKQACEAFGVLQDTLWRELGIAGMSGQN